MQALTSQMRRTFPTLPQVTTTDAAGISNLQIVKGTCDSSSHTAEGPLGIDLTKRQSRFFCDSAVITFFDDYKGHEMVGFFAPRSHHSPILGFAGRVEDDGIMMQVDTVYLVPGQAMKVSDGWCKFFSKNRQMSDIVCGMKVEVDEDRAANYRSGGIQRCARPMTRCLSSLRYPPGVRAFRSMIDDLPKSAQQQGLSHSWRLCRRGE